MLEEHLSHEQIMSLAEDFNDYFTIVTLKRGLAYYRQGRIYNILVHDSLVEAIVKGTHNYAVQIDLNNFNHSRCSCPVHENCKHMAALFFNLYARYENPEIFVHNMPPNRYNPVSVINNTVIARVRPILLPEADGTIAQWQKFFTENFNRQSPYSNYNYNNYFFEILIDELNKLALDWPSPNREFYRFHSCLFIMDKMETYVRRSQQQYYFAPSQLVHAGKMIDYLMKASSVITNPAYLEKHQFQVEAALEQLRAITFQDTNNYFDWLWIYRLLWSNYFAHQALVDREGRELDKFITSKKQSPTAQHNIHVASAHLQFIMGNEQTAMQVLEEVGAKISDILLYLYSFAHYKNWGQLENWLHWLAPGLKFATNREMADICHLWLKLAAERQDYTEALSLMKSLLPHCSLQYEEGLLHAGHYQTWVEYHLYNQSLPIDLGRDAIKIVASHDVSLLLPLYHQAVIRYIEHKNRLAYKMAVRMLKKLQTYYKKLKRTDEWNLYLKGLNARYSRLRALQEEMRKGQLI